MTSQTVTPTFKTRNKPGSDDAFMAYVDWKGLDKGEMRTRFGYYKTREIAAQEAQRRIDSFLEYLATENA